jgi:hypothetical protein
MSSPLLRIFPQAAPSLSPRLHPLLGGQQSCTAAIRRFPARRPADPPELSSRPRHRRHLIFSYCRSTHLHRARRYEWGFGGKGYKDEQNWKMEARPTSGILTGEWRRDFFCTNCAEELWNAGWGVFPLPVEYGQPILIAKCTPRPD